jgi:hypothetical protein
MIQTQGAKEIFDGLREWIRKLGLHSEEFVVDTHRENEVVVRFFFKGEHIELVYREDGKDQIVPDLERKLAKLKKQGFDGTDLYAETKAQLDLLRAGIK